MSFLFPSNSKDGAESIFSLEKDIRHLIRYLQEIGEIVLDLKSSNIVFSALDAVNDTEVAVIDFLSEYESGSLGKKYLLLYGLFQALQTQQDVVKALCKNFSISDRPITKNLKDIRTIRSVGVAHPTKSKANKVWRTGFVARASLHGEKITLVTAYDDERKAEFTEIDLPDLIARQSKVIMEVLDRVKDKLIQTKEEHRQKFSAVKLSDVFHSSIDWIMGQIESGIIDDEKGPMAKANLEFIEKTLQKYIDLLKARGKQHDNYLRYTVQPCVHCIVRLRMYFENGKSCISKKDAEIFADWLRSKLKELEDYAKNIDKEYELK